MNLIDNLINHTMKTIKITELIKTESKKNMTRLMAILFAVLGTFAANAQGSLSGTGTESDPYLINNAADLDDMRNYLLGGSKDKYFRLTADIDLTEYIATGQGTASSTEGWLPIDNDTTSFQGNLNGGGHKITGLWINQSITSPYDAVGLFESVHNESSIDSLGIEIASRGVKGTKNNSPVGGLVGRLTGSRINNCHVTGTVSGAAFYVGGLVGLNRNGSINNSHAAVMVSGTYEVGGLVGVNALKCSISNSYATGTVSGTAQVGGLAGGHLGDSIISISNCYATGTVSGTYEIGGLVGEIHEKNSIIIDSYATGAVSGTAYSVGGLVGFGALYSEITGCYATGAVSGNDGVGGLVGNNSCTVNKSYASGAVLGIVYIGGLTGKSHGTGLGVYNCYATGAVSGSAYVGGLTGFNEILVNSCYATGMVTGNNYVGGLMGYNISIITNCYYNKDNYSGTGIGADENSIGVTALTDTQMRQQASFAGWDFDTVWEIREGVSYPYFRPGGSPIANGKVEADRAMVYALGGTVYINSPVSEQIDVYSIDGALLCHSTKPSGATTLNTTRFPQGILIVKGNGWVRKIRN
jgi:hypothetical protein